MKPTAGDNLGSEAGQPGVIYVVEDDPKLLEYIAMTLAVLPWQTKTFNDPEPAIRSFLQETPKPALLLTDFSMKSMDGLELGKRLRKIHPGLKVILMSGTLESEIVGLDPGLLSGFLSKPFIPKGLLGTVRSVLES
jgi:DNA-binding response OmpR family regulator